MGSFFSSLARIIIPGRAACDTTCAPCVSPRELDAVAVCNGPLVRMMHGVWYVHGPEMPSL